MADLFIDSEFHSIIPPLSVEEYAGLEASIIREGNRVPIDTWNGTIVDGHNRYDICTKHNIPLKPANELHFADRDEAKIWIINNQLDRRNLNNYQRSVLALRLEGIIAARAKAKYVATVGRPSKSVPTLAPITAIDTREELAIKADVSHGTLAKVKEIEAKASPAQKAKLAKGEVTINKVYNSIKSTKVDIVEPPDYKRTNVSLLLGDMVDIVPQLGKFDLIIADPPYNVTDYDWDNIPDYLARVEIWLTVCKNALSDKSHLFWFCSPQYTADVEMIFRKLDMPIKSRIIWHRRNMSMGSQAVNKFLGSWEMIFHIGTTELNFPDKWDDTRFDVQTYAVPQTNFKDTKFHPAQKPVKLIKWLVRYGSFASSRILDPFAGVATTGIACNENECILIEQNEEYVRIARQRLGQ